MDHAAQHLVATAQAQHQAAPADMGVQVDVPAFMPQCRQIGDGGFGTGDDHQPCVSRDRLSGLNEVHGNTGFKTQRIEIVEIGDAAQAQNRNSDCTGMACERFLQSHRIFGGEVSGGGEMRHDAEAGSSRARFEKAPAFRKQFRIAMELVDQEAF